MQVSRILDRTTILAEVSDSARLVFGDPLLDVTPATSLDDIPAWDSMSHIALVVEVEYRFDIEFQAAEIDDIRTIGELVTMIQAKRAVIPAA
jgi:acyl carrier protein